MGIWDSLRRFSAQGASSRESSTKKRLGAGRPRLRERGLRLEQFEDRMLLSITATDAGQPGFETQPVTLPASGEIQLLVAADSVDDLRYKITHNVDAADTTNAEDLQVGGSLDLDLTGSGYTAGVWDGGAVLSTHQEFDGRVSIIDGALPADHATHVAGTIGAAGVDTDAQGMATEVEIRSYDWDSDYAEMAADANLIDVSNHSYGLIGGWTVFADPSTTSGLLDFWFGDMSVSTVEDASFGQYTSSTAQLDQVLNTNPSLLSVWSAGNDRNDQYLDISGDDVFATFFSVDPGLQGWAGPGLYIVDDTTFTPPPSDGDGGTGYDSISPAQTAKNVLTVGAVDDVTADPYFSTSIAMSTFSSWGPTDDGRIKPDVVGNGVDLYSTLSDADDSYGISSGTSMASPNVAGTSLLLIEHFENEMGYSPQSATTKGLIIHTASDAGSLGPDYAYGWGLVDALAAAEFTTNAAEGDEQFQIMEGTYQGSDISLDLYSAGLNPLTVTLAWNDPAGTPGTGELDDRTSRLVNDLDIWIEDASGNVYYPWSLDPANPAAGAIQIQPNHVDNVEQVQISAPFPGEYTVHIGSTGGVVSQDYSLFVSNEGIAVAPELVLVIPQEGGFIDRGDTLNVAPRELILRFNEGQRFIDSTTTPPLDPNNWLSGGRDGIQVTRSVNGVWGDGDDEIVEIGWIGIGDRENDVVLRFAEALPDDDYRISIIGSDNYVGPDGQLVPPLRNIQFLKFRDGQAIVNEHFEFELDLGAQVTAVVPQPVVVAEATLTAATSLSGSDVRDGTTFTVSDGRDQVVFEFNNPSSVGYVAGIKSTSDVQISIGGSSSSADIAQLVATAIHGVTAVQGGPLDVAVGYALGQRVVRVSGERVAIYGESLPLTVTESREQLEDTIDVYFNDDDLDPVSVERPEFYQLIVTNDTATTDDDLLYDPADGSVQLRALQPVEVRYDPTLDKAILRFDKPLHDYGTGAFRLRVGNEYKKIETSSLTPSVEIVNGSLTQSGFATLLTPTSSETIDGTTFRMGDGQNEVSLELDVRAVVISVANAAALQDGTIVELNDGDGMTRFEINNPFGPGYSPGFSDGSANPITITANSAAQAILDIRSALAAAGFSTYLDPTTVGRLLVADTLDATVTGAGLATATPTFSLLEPTDLSTLVDGEWVEVNGGRYELDLPAANGGDNAVNDPASDDLVDVTGTGAGGALAAGDVARDLAARLRANSIAAIAVDTRVFLLDATSATGAVPAVSVDSSIYSIQAPAVISEVQDGEWLEVNTGSDVLRFEFDRNGSVDSAAVGVDISGGNILGALNTALSGQGITALLSGDRLIVSGVSHIEQGGVDPDMIVAKGFAVEVPGNLDVENDGEYIEVSDGHGTTRFEFDDPSHGSVAAAAVPIAISGSATTDAGRLEQEVSNRGYTTVLSGSRVFVFDVDEVTVGDVSDLHMAVEEPGMASGSPDAVVAFHAGMTAEQIAAAMVAEMEAAIDAAGLYLSVDQTGASVSVSPMEEAGDSFHSANDLWNFGNQAGAHSLIVSAAIDPQELLLEWPGAVDEPGHRDLAWHPDTLIEDHYTTGDSNPDGTDGITEYYYNFGDVYGFDPASGAPLLNNITEAQMERAREVFTLYSEYLGVSFVETVDQGFLIATGDLKATGVLQSAPGGVAGVAFGNVALMDQAESWGASEFGGSWFTVAMHEIGHLLGYGHAYDLVAGAIMGSSEDSLSGINTEPIFPGAHDIVHGQHMYRPDSIDIDLYRFELEERGTLSAEVLAERLNDSSQLDSVVTIYRQVTVEDADGNPKTTYEVVARNDDYYSKDSFLELYLQPGIYFAGVSASGNSDYDPNIDNTGVGGTSQGQYKLRLTFAPGGVDPDDPTTFRGDGIDHLVDADGTPTKFDGDADGIPGGAYNFWFNVQEETIFVDKTSTSAVEDGTLQNPYKTIDKALAQKGTPGAVVRVLGNNYYNDDPNDWTTYDDNVPYQIGMNPDTTQTLEDGRRLEVPQGVTLVIDAGAVFKMSAANVDVGSTAEGIDRSEGALQVLGTPDNLVMFTSFRDAQIGIDIDPSNKAPAKGDWGGLVFRNELDYDFIADYDPASGLDPRQVLETQGVFLNYVNHADIRYGGGAVEVDGVKSVYTPLHLIESRPTITYNRITQSADAAISGDPNSFADTRFESWDAYAPFTARYTRVGPDVRGNYVVENSTNGMFVRISTAAGQAIKELEVPGRFDDWDIVHVIPENLFVNGTPGGPVLSEETNPLFLIDSNHIWALAGSAIPDQTTFSIFDGSTRVVFEFDLGNGYSPGHIPISYAPSSTADEVAAAIRVAIDQGGNQYGLDVAVDLEEPGRIVSITNTGPLVRLEGFGTYDARLDARLQIDPGMIVKLDGSRIEVEMGAQLIAEGRAGSDEGAPGYKVIVTSLLDDRYGAGGSFNTAAITSGATADAGDWGGIYFAPTSSGSISESIIAYGGGATAIEGGFANFNTVEIRQAQVRIANSRFENNAANMAGDRNGRGPSNAATIQVRGAQPVIVGNDFVDNRGAVVSIDLNSLVSETIADWGQSTGFLNDYEAYASNHGPLVRANRMTNNGINGMEVRAGTVTTDSVWDDTDIVHVVYDEIYVPNYHHEGVLRLQSSDAQSLVVKLSGTNAGFTAGGEPLEIDDRIGGTLQILGRPGHPVVLTGLSDDTVGAGFTLDNLPQTDTNNDSSGDGSGGTGTLPVGPEVDNGLLIDNDVPDNVAGHFEVQPGAGGEINFASAQGVTADGNSTFFQNARFIFEFLNYVDVGADGGAINLSQTTVTMQPTLISPDVVASEGNFAGPNGTVNWRVETYLINGDPRVNNRVTFTSDAPLGNIRYISYLDEDVLGVSDDILWTTGTPGQPDFRAYTLDGSERIGFSHGGVYLPGTGLVNATYEGWAADQFAELRTIIAGAGTNYTIPGNIDLTDLPASQDADLGTVYGPNDVTTAFAWAVSPSATSSTMTSFLELVPRNPASQPGEWRSIKIDEYSNDRNVGVANEIELPYGETSDTNAHPSLAQPLGSMAPEDKAGDDNLRLGFEVHGTIRTDDPADADVYSFSAPAGTEIWLDVDRSNHALDLVVELVDADGNVLARSDNSYFEELSGEVEDLSAESYTMDRDYWLRHDFYTTNDRDPGMRLVLPGPEGQMRTYYVRVRSVLAIGAIPSASEVTEGQTFTIGDSFMKFTFEFTTDATVSGNNIPVSMLTQTGELRTAPEMAEAIIDAVAEARLEGLQATARLRDGNVVLDGPHLRFNALDTQLDHLANTSGEYQLQIRLEEMQEIPGSTVQYADIRYATNGIEILGQPGHSPLLGETSEATDNNDTAGQAQEIGNLLATDRNAISVAGYLEDRTDVDWYSMSVDLEGIQSIPGISNLGSIWATIFDIDYADQMARADLNLWVFDSNRNLILMGGASNVADDQPEPIPGAVIEDLSRGSVGARDPFIGSAYLQEGDGNRGVYYIAITSTLAVPTELDTEISPLTRREPLDSVNRIASEHFTYSDFEQPYNKINTSDSDYMGVRLDPIPYEFTLSDTILYVSIGEDLFTVDPFTGAFETEVTQIGGNTYLPGVGNTLYYDDIDMRSDGRLFTIQSGRTGGSTGRQEPDTLMLSTEDARNALQTNDTGITFYRRDPNNANALQRDPHGGIQFEAIVNDWDNGRRNIYAVGTASSSLSELNYENLMYVLDPSGVAYTHPSIPPRASGAREYSGEKVPLGKLYTAPTLVLQNALSIQTGDWFEVTYTDPIGGTSRTVRFTFDATVAINSQTGPDDVQIGTLNVLDERDAAFQIRNAINLVTPQATFNVQASLTGSDVAVGGVTVNDINLAGMSFNAIDLAGDAGSGGHITGIAYVGSQMYAVSDRGDLFAVDNEHGNPGSAGSYAFQPVDPDGTYNRVIHNPNAGPRLTFIANINYGGTPIQFSGVTDGPSNADGGIHGQSLFATDSTGHLYAIDLDGNLLPIFNDGAERLQLHRNTSGSSMGAFVSNVESDANARPAVTGLAFSPIDFNLWHMTSNRADDLGHGVTQTHDGIRGVETGYGPSSSLTRGYRSMYFGLEDPDRTPGGSWDQPIGDDFERGPGNIHNAYYTYDLPGGAHGSFSTTTFSLDGYAEQDEPVLYFNYYAETENSDDYDGLRVYISNDGAKWDLISTNTDTDDGTRRLYGLGQEMQTPTVPTRIVDEIVDTGGAWRQARVDLSRYAGLDNLRLRFDFSTASDMEIGGDENNTTVGNQHHYVAPVPAYEIRDGDTFSVDGQTFEFDLGLSLVLPNVAGRAIADEEWFEVDDGVGGVVQFEFEKGGGVTSGRVPITIDDTMSTAEVIQQMIATINASLDVEGLAPNLDKDPNRLFLARAMALDVSGAPHLTIDGDTPGTVASGNIRVPLRGDMDLLEVGDVITNVVNQQYLRSIDTTSGTSTTTSPEVLRVPSTNVGSFTLEATTARGETRTVRFIEDLNSTTPAVVSQGTVFIGMSGVSTTAEAAQRIADAINAANTGASSTLPELVVSAVAATRDTGSAIIDVVQFDLTATPFTNFDAGNSTVYLWSGDTSIINWDTDVGDLLNLVGHSLVNSFGAADYGPLGYSGSSAGQAQNNYLYSLFGELPGDDNIRKPNYGGNRGDNRFNLFERGQDNNYEGFYIDDIIVGFAERGELVTDASRDGTLTDFTFAPAPDANLYIQSPSDPEQPIVTEGSYQLEVRTGANYGMYVGGASYPVTIVTETFDTNDRLAADYTITVPAANEIYHGQWFEISDGRDDVRQRFVFVDQAVGGGAGLGNTRIDFAVGDSADTMAIRIANAINQAKVSGELDVSAGFVANSNTIDLFGAVRIHNAPEAANPITFTYYPTTGGDATLDGGDRNLEREKGQIVIAGNSITNSLEYGIVVAPGARNTTDDQSPHPASGRTMNDPNNLVPGIMIENNLVAYSGDGGIRFSGETNAAGEPVGAIPFGRIVNNTIFGNADTPTGVGILVENNAAPTLLNNIVANLGVGVRVDTSSASNTVLGGMLYQGNTQAVQGTGVGSFAVTLGPSDPLFVDAAGGNFYLDHGSLAIDSSIDSLEERLGFYNSVLEPLDIPVSPILAPEDDLYGQLRRDDPSAASPVGLGGNVFKDRGAIDRVDFVAPTSSITVPLDNGPLDQLPQVAHNVKVVGEKVLKFTIQLRDTGGVGIDDSTVDTTAVHVYRDLDAATYLDPLTRDPELVEGIDYKMVYNATNDTIDLIPLAGLWAEGRDYTIVLDDTIRDEANNPLQANRFSGTFNGLTVFEVSLAGLDFGDAPESYTTLLEDDGPRHVLFSHFYLGDGIDSETDARTTSAADGDAFDDGVTLAGSGMLAGEDAELTIDVTLQNEALIDQYGGVAFLGAWFDFNQNGTFEVQEFQLQSVQDGLNTMVVAVPAGISGEVAARFRFGSVLSEVSTLTGQASDGEVEDYVFNVVEFLKDFGDAPLPYPTAEASGGAWHATNVTPDLFLGTVRPDSELDGVPNSQAQSDDTRNTDDEDGVDVANRVFLADGVADGNSISVTVSGVANTTAYLNAWIDLNADGDWADSGEQFIVGDAFTFAAGNTTITRDFDFTIPTLPGGIERASTFARFRVSSFQNLGYTGGSAIEPGSGNVVTVDGEVEDYQIFLVSELRDYGDAPDDISGVADYPTLISSNGASHAIVPGLALGQAIDAEFDGQPRLQANGDDDAYPTGGGDDEDGILFEAYGIDALSRLIPGETALVNANVTNTTGEQAYLYGWIDFNRDGDWDDPGEQVFGDASGGLAIDADVNAAEDNILSIDIPDLFDGIDPNAISELGDTYARFRLTTDTGVLTYAGAASDGEVEDYQVAIEVGEGSIQGRKFNDLDGDGQYDSFTEPGLSGVTVYLDINDNGQYDQLDINGDGSIDWSEPRTVTGRDNLGTPGVDETGQFEFTDVFSGTYTVRELLDDEWVQTYPSEPGYAPDVNGNKLRSVAGLDLADGDSFSVSDGTVTRLFEFEDVNLGNGTSVSTIAVEFTSTMTAEEVAGAIAAAVDGAGMNLLVSLENDVVILDADVDANPSAAVVIDAQNSMLVVLGDTLVNPDLSYTVELEPGETVTGVVFGNYRKPTISVSDVSVVEGDSGQITYVNVEFERTGSFAAPVEVFYRTQPDTADENVDYLGTSGSFTFMPQTAPQTQWITQSITQNETNDYDYHVSGDSVVFEMIDGNDWDIFVYNNSVGGEPVALTGLSGNGRETLDDRFADLYRVGSGTSGSIYVTWSGYDGNDYEIYFAEVDVNSNQLVPGSIQQLTNNSRDDKSPKISDSHITWWGFDSFGDRDVYVQTIATIGVPGGGPVNVSSNFVDDYDPQIDGSNVVWHSQVGQSTEIFLWDGTLTRQITSNQADNEFPQVSGESVVWQGLDGSDSEIFAYDIDTQQITQLTVNDTEDIAPQLSGGNVVWQGGSDFRRDIYLSGVDDSGSAVNISNSFRLDERPVIAGDRIAWHRFDGFDWEVMTYDLSDSTFAQNVSNNMVYDWGPQVSEELLVWRSNDGQDFEIVVAGREVPVVRQSVQVAIIGDDLLEDDEQFFVELDNVDPDDFLVGGVQGTVAIYNDDGQLDFGDAPTSYHTRIADNGPRHVIDDPLTAGYYLGAGVDAEGNGRVSSAATGDDVSGTDDEDGVVINSHWLPGGVVELVVTASQAGYLDGWVDYNRDGDFGNAAGVADRDEYLRLESLPAGQTPQSIPLDAGENVLYIAVPDNAVLGDSFARFRFSESGGLGYLGSVRGGEVEDYAIRITEDMPGVVITETGGGTSVSESGTTDSYQIVLSAQPSATVTVDIAGNADVTLNPTQVKFTRDNWDVPRTVTVSAVDDLIAERAVDNSAAVTHTVTSSDFAYNGIAVPTVQVAVADNDTANVRILRDGATEVSEDGTLTDSYQVVLQSQPMGNVHVIVDAGDQLLVESAGSGAPADQIMLTFTATNWSTAQTVNVTAVDDDVAEGDDTVFIQHTVTSTTDPVYNAMGSAIPTVKVEITDNDTAGVVIVGNVSVWESDGSTDSYQVLLASEPIGTVSVQVTADDQVLVAEADAGGNPTGGFAETVTLTFDASNWNTPQTVAVRAADDDVDEDSHTGLISHSVTSATDSSYHGISAGSVVVGIEEPIGEDEAGLTIEHNVPFVVQEGGQSNAYTAKLNSEPMGTVTVQVLTGAQLDPSTNALVFTPANWNVAQTVTIDATDDLVAEGTHFAVVKFASQSDADTKYDELADIDKTVTIADNDEAEVEVLLAGTSLDVAEAGPSVQYRLALTSKPTANVTISIGGDDQLTIVPTEVVFTPADWQQERFVTVAAFDDKIAEGDHGTTIAHAVTSSDGFYDGVAVADVPVNITDNDTAGVEITEQSGSTNVSEAGQTDVYVIKLTSQPTANVLIDLQTDGQVSTLPSSITFTPENWTEARSVIVRAVNDLIAEGPHTGTVSHVLNSSDPSYNGLSVPNVVANIADNDSAAVIVTETEGATAVTEGGTTDSYSVHLAARPDQNVTISLTPAADLGVDPAQLVFTPDNWGQAQTVSIWAVDDSEEEDTEVVSIEHTVASGDPAYNGMPVSPVWAEVTDNDETSIGDTLPLTGTEGDDSLVLVRGEQLLVTLNGAVVYQGTGVKTVTFDALGGTDSVDVTGSDEFETALLNPFDITFEGTDFQFTATNVEQSLIKNAGGGGVVEFNDSLGDDTVTGSPTGMTMSGDGFVNRAEGFSSMMPYSRSAGYDTIRLEDSTGRDKVKVEANDVVKLYNSTYYIRSKFFENVEVTSTGGADTALVWDTLADDTVDASYNQVVVHTGTNVAAGVRRQIATINGFEYPTIYSVIGGYDTLNLYDSPADDKAVLRMDRATIYPRTTENPYEFEISARDFDMVHAEASDGLDVIRIHDSAGVDLLTADYVDGVSYASLAVDGSVIYDARAYEVVSAMNDFFDNPKNQKDVDEAVDFLVLDEAFWEDV